MIWQSELTRGRAVLRLPNLRQLRVDQPSRFSEAAQHDSLIDCISARREEQHPVLRGPQLSWLRLCRSRVNAGLVACGVGVRTGAGECTRIDDQVFIAYRPAFEIALEDLSGTCGVARLGRE